MASLLSGVQFLQNFGIFTFVMPFILIFAIAYGILLYIQPFGDDKILNSVLAFVIAFMSLQFMPILVFIQYIVPYLFAVFMIMFMVILLFKFIGVKDDTMQSAYTHPGVYGVVIAVIVIGVFIFMSESFPELSVSNQDPGGSKVSSTLGGVYTGDETDDTGSNTHIITTETDDGTVTVINSDEDGSDERQDLLRNTIFHPTILSLIVMFIIFGSASYFLVTIK